MKTVGVGAKKPLELDAALREENKQLSLELETLREVPAKQTKK